MSHKTAIEKPEVERELTVNIQVDVVQFSAGIFGVAITIPPECERIGLECGTAALLAHEIAKAAREALALNRGDDGAAPSSSKIIIPGLH